MEKGFFARTTSDLEAASMQTETQSFQTADKPSGYDDANMPTPGENIGHTESRSVGEEVKLDLLRFH